MGVRYLNRFLLTKDICGIHKILLRSLYKKWIVVDTSIYLYKFKSIGLLLENMEKLIVLFKELHIYPIFVFDGEPKMNKRRVLKERKLNKKIAWKLYSESPNASEEEKAILKSRFTRVSKKNTDDVKIMMDKYNVHYVTAPMKPTNYVLDL